MVLSGCSKHNISQYNDSSPKMSLEEYFSGTILAWGIVQDRKGKVIQRFDITMQGSWTDGVGTLNEDFVYYDGKTQNRVWTIEKITDTTYEGSASDIIGKAQGEVNGYAMRWNYKMDLPVGERTYRITFDDWMFRLNDDVLVNRSYLKKFGITFAELSLFMKKVNDESKE